MSNERPTFSPLWHRVRALKPRLRPHVQITRQHYRGRRWHVAHDPASNQFYRLSPVGYEFVGLLDGKRTVEEVWSISLGNHGDGAPTQQEVIELLGQMYSSNLLAIDSTPETEQLLSRGRDRLKRRMAQQAIGLMYFRLRLFNPDRILTWLEPIFRPLLNRWGFLLWLAWVGYGVYAVVPHLDELRAMFKTSMAPANLIWLSVIFIVIKAIHETGHGVICKRFGGQVPEFGAMLLVLVPAPYVDASSAWSFASKWQRIAVGAGGMIFELAVAAAAVHIFASAPDTLTKQLAFNAIFTASISTIFFNANPLMRFDGYYILSDLLEVPNLMNRSTRMLQHLAQKYIYRCENLRPPTTNPTERWILIVYGTLAVAYRVFLFITITLYVMGQFFAVGLVLAVWSAAAWFLIPLGKFVHWLAAGPQLAEHRVRAIATTLGLAGAAWVCLGVVRAPDYRRAPGVVESRARSGVYFGAPGRVVTVHKRVGDWVRAGDVIVTCESPAVEYGIAMTRAELAETLVKERMYTAGNPAAAQVARSIVEAKAETLRTLLDLRSKLEVRAPQDGVLVPGASGRDPWEFAGVHVQRGQLLCEVVDPERVRVAATMPTAHAQPLIELPPGGYTVEMRPVSMPYTVVRGEGVRIVEAGRRTIPHAALGFQGGGTVEIDPQDQRGLATKSSEFTVYIDDLVKDGRAWRSVPGERVTVRFTLPSKPLLAQWWHRVERLLQARTDI